MARLVAEPTFVGAAAEAAAETADGTVTASTGQAIVALAGDWVRSATPGEGGARHVSVCIPAFTPERVRRDG